jgi:hypothetical protein
MHLLTITFANGERRTFALSNEMLALTLTLGEAILTNGEIVRTELYAEKRPARTV